MKYQRQKWGAMFCAAAVWFCFISSHSIQAAQTDPTSGSTTVHAASSFETTLLKDSPANATVFSGIEWSSIATVVAIVLIGYNLLTSRKQGWGWILCCAVGVVFAFIGRLCASMFCEISSDSTGISDWDSD